LHSSAILSAYSVIPYQHSEQPTSLILKGQEIQEAGNTWYMVYIGKAVGSDRFSVTMTPELPQHTQV